jgi:hypothetical protein
VKRKLLALIIAGTSVLALAACDPATDAKNTIAGIFGDQAGEAVAIANCESHLDPAAVSSGGGNFGLFQINSVHKEAFTEVTGQPWTAVYDAYWNAVFAKHLYDQQGWGPWACKRVL